MMDGATRRPNGSPLGETSPAEPWIFSSPDLLTVADPNKATWELLPEGDVGVMPPDGSTRLLEENHLVMVGDDTQRLLMLGRSDVGKVWGTYSSDFPATVTIPVQGAGVVSI